MTNIKFHLMIYKDGKPIKRQTISKPFFLAGSFPMSSLVLKDKSGGDVLSGLFYWKSKEELVFKNFKTNGEEANPNGRFEFNKGQFKIQLMSICVGEPPMLDISKVIPHALSASKKTRLNAIFGFMGIVILGGAITFYIAKRNIKVKEPSIQPLATEVEIIPTIKSVSPPKMDQKYFYQVLKRNRHDIEECQYEHEFKDGLVKYKASINGEGLVRQLLVMSQDVGSDALLKCIENKITHWKFLQTPISENTVFFALALKNQ